MTSTAAKFIAGTGTISGDGKVGPIGGITHKMVAAHEAGATVFLVPADNCDEAVTGEQDGMQLVKVDTLGDGGRRAARAVPPVANLRTAEPDGTLPRVLAYSCGTFGS